MEAKAESRYTRTYSQLEGLQGAYTVSYTARDATLEVRRERDGDEYACAALCRNTGPERLGQVALYLYENGVAPEQLPEVLEDLGVECSCTVSNGAFCGI